MWFGKLFSESVNSKSHMVQIYFRIIIFVNSTRMNLTCLYPARLLTINSANMTKENREPVRLVFFTGWIFGGLCASFWPARF